MTRYIIIAMGLLVIILGIARAQNASTPNPVAAACVYSSTAPAAATTGSFVFLHCDSTGRIAVH
jgi:uncharacterized membrane protein